MNRKPSDRTLSRSYSDSPRSPTRESEQTNSFGLPQILLVMCVTVALTGVIVAGVVAVVGDGGSTYIPPASGGTDDPVVIGGLNNGTDTVSLYNEVSPSVVSIYAMNDGSGEKTTSQGSGFVYDDRGHIVTNEHVVKEDSTLYVQFADGSWTKAELVGTDKYTDIAVLKVDQTPSEATPLQLADRLPEEGEPVLALGAPHDLSGTLTTGVVSGVERNMKAYSGFTIPDAIQTDAALNPGNSGGPLVSSEGRVLGINRAKQGENIGFAISSRLADRVVRGLIADGEVQHPYLGIRSVPLTPPLAEEQGLNQQTGALVVETVEDAPAHGILRGGESTNNGSEIPQGGDVIVGIGGEEVRSNEDLASYLMRKTSPGETVEIEIIRDGERRTVEVTLDSRK